MKHTSSQKLFRIKRKRNKLLRHKLNPGIEELDKLPYDEPEYLPCIGHRHLSKIMQKAKEEKVTIIYVTEEWPTI